MANPNTEADISRALEVSIHVGLLILLAGTCFLILRPFLPLILWGIIIAIAAYPGYRLLRTKLGGRSALAAVVFTGILFVLFALPLFLLARPLVDGIQGLAARLAQGTPIIPPPPPRVETWPLIGPRLKDVWELASKNVSAAVQTFAPQIKTIIPRLLSFSAELGLAMLQWVLSILVAGILLANANSGAGMAHSLATHFLGSRAPEFEELVAATVRSVTTGIIGVALIQSVFASLGFVVAGLPGAGVWSLLFVFGAVLQVGVLVLAPAVIYMFAIAGTTKAILFLVWCLIVGLMDNVLKPLMLGRGVAVPMAVVFLGAIGGLLAMGTIGLFVGAIVLSIGYKLFLAWLEGTPRVSAELPRQSTPAQAGS